MFIPSERSIDGGEILYLIARPALYVLRDGTLEKMVDLHDGANWLWRSNIPSADTIRRIYQSGERLVVESRRAARCYRRNVAVVEVNTVFGPGERIQLNRRCANFAIVGPLREF
jgi:hypothetical protein